ncbi:hypothetical protein TREMEDRAFT_74318 [Tremella mesenterica DSM 1558]|uniref:uncharacterized protein n=1 Tax=Tremella mesenterica (strain ATCC 24925 / CBS 8224 / DSM 1558 / NBRC 9311 / NRRL Y-6157 / RJB 2259-6 / UBC 559-6) TaxID=578456 RepID=UPI0003F48D9D|nr:uncharacterized protein TREMEDRAFT_74318 [Tremella mesenterica DSM 1558]EIW67828.1 hypothetical protein TREMEDRAFT_74318 [Tremella mesenterica DSM 1558]
MSLLRLSRATLSVPRSVQTSRIRYASTISVTSTHWKELTIDEKKAAYFVAFGPHGPRAPIHHPGNAMRVIGGVAGCVGVAIAIFYAVRSQAPPLPKTMTREYQEQTNEYLRAQNSNPIHGISSEGYKGKGAVTV